MNKTQNSGSELSYDTKTIIVIALLIVLYPVGVILMIKWMNWSKGLKVLLTLPLVLGVWIFFGVMGEGIRTVVNFDAQKDKALQQKTENLIQVKRDDCQVKCEVQLSQITKATDKAKFDMNTCISSCLAK